MRTFPVISNYGFVYFIHKIIANIHFVASLQNVLFSFAASLGVFTFRPFLFLLHLPAVRLQHLVRLHGEGIGTRLANDNFGLVLLFNDGLGRSHQLPLQDTEEIRGCQLNINE